MKLAPQPENTARPTLVADRPATAEPAWWGDLFPAEPAPEESEPVIEAPPAPIQRRRRLSMRVGAIRHPKRWTPIQRDAHIRATGGSGCPICGLPASRCRWWARNGG